MPVSFRRRAVTTGVLGTGGGAAICKPNETTPSCFVAGWNTSNVKPSDDA